MISRRRILSRSRDDLNTTEAYAVHEEEEDVWYNRDKLYKDHIQEVLDKWTQIDDEIWAKVIVLERNRRVAKAYARAPVLTVNGSDDGFDGFRIGLCGFENPMRDAKTEEIKRHIGHGVKVKMDDQGNILIKRVSKCNVYVKNTSNNGEESSVGNEVLKLNNCALEMDKPVKLFDMKKFQQNVSRELRGAYPDRRRLERQCLSAVAFVKSEQEVIDCPIWVLIVNVVAMDMLKAKLPPVFSAAVKRPPMDIRNRPRIPIPDEDPYSVAGSGGSSGSSGVGGSGGSASASNGGGVVAATREQLQHQLMQQQRRSERPPKLPPRDSMHSPTGFEIPKPDYDDLDDHEEDTPRLKPFQSSRPSKEKVKENMKQKYDDPYYCGLRARVPNFAKAGAGGREPQPAPRHHRESVVLHHAAAAGHHHHHHPPHSTQQPPASFHPAMWHARSYDSGMDSEALESPYHQIYGRLPIPTRAFIPPTPRQMYIGEWD